MREAELARQILYELLDGLPEQGAARVEAVRARVEVVEPLDPEALAFWFRVEAAGTPAAGAWLTLVEERLSLECLACGARFQAEDTALSCPACGSGAARLDRPPRVFIEHQELLGLGV